MLHPRFGPTLTLIRTKTLQKTLSSDLSGPSVEPRVIRKHYATEMAVERTRLLYQGSLLPTLFMLLNGLVCAGLLWSPQRYFVVSVWLVWLLSLVALRVIQVAAFDSAIPDRQAQAIWFRMFLLGSTMTGLTLAGAGIALVPADNFIQQAWVFGLIGVAYFPGLADRTRKHRPIGTALLVVTAVGLTIVLTAPSGAAPKPAPAVTASGWLAPGAGGLVLRGAL